jgi:hypothetical protein
MANAIDFIGSVYNTLAKTLHVQNASDSEFILYSSVENSQFPQFVDIYPISI